MDERLLGAEPENIRNLPRRIWVESKKIWRIAFPAMLARVTQFGMFVVTQAFIGHLGEVDLAAYALIQILTVRFVNGILVSIFIILFSSSSCVWYLGFKSYLLKWYYMINYSILSKYSDGVLLFSYSFLSLHHECYTFIILRQFTISEILILFSTLFKKLRCCSNLNYITKI